MKNNYKQDATGLREVLNELDFIGIYPSLGGPKDEYDCMIYPILSRLYAQATKEQIEKYLIGELSEHFGIDDIEFIQRIKAVDKIIDWWKNK